MSDMEEIIDKLIRTKVNEEAISIERIHFYKTDKRVNPRQEEPFKFLPGRVPVLVSAPHAVRHIRQKKIKKSDEYTGSMAFLLNQLTGCHTLAVTKLYGGDPNADNPCYYKDKLGEIIQNNKIAFVLDLHGAGRDHSFDVDIGSIGGNSLLNKAFLLDKIISSFKAAGLTEISQDHFAAAGPNTITRFISQELQIPAVQLEINRKYRVPAQNSQAFSRMIAALSQVIEAVH